MVLQNLTFSEAKEQPAPSQPTSKPEKQQKKRGRGDQRATTSQTGATRSLPAQAYPDDISKSPLKTLGSAPQDDLSNTQEGSVVQSIENQPPKALPVADDVVEGAIILDAANSERQIWTDQVGRSQREVWRPGDGDGDKAAGYYEKPGPKAPLQTRWRFFQSRVGAEPIKRDINEPPKYVVLDDRTAYECLASDIARQYLGQYWNHDFSGSGVVRSRRPHRGRGAVGDADAPGEHKYQFTVIGTRGDKYYFSGEKDYKPIIYHTTDPTLATDVFRPPKRSQPLPKKELPPNKHGHNQFTPKDQMVKLGAPHKGSSWLRYSKRVNPFLTREKTPPLRSHGGMSTLHARDPAEATQQLNGRKSRSDSKFGGTAGDESESLWMEEGERSTKRQRMSSSKSTPFEDDRDDEGGGEEGYRSEYLPSDTALSMDDAASARTPREKLVEQPDFFAQMSINKDPTSDGTNGTVPGPVKVKVESEEDSGSYATKLEAKLVAAQKTIEEQNDQVAAATMITQQQRSQIDELQKACDEAKSKVDEQAGEIEQLKGKLGVPASTGEKTCDEANSKVDEQARGIAEMEGKVGVSSTTDGDK